MTTFKFSSNTGPAQNNSTKFIGKQFYGVYKNAEFLRTSANIETILSKGYELRHQLKAVAPGDTVTIAGMVLERSTPLLVKKTGPNVAVEDYEFTTNRLTGVTAAYAFENRHRFPVIKSSEAETLGLTWDHSNEEKCRMYLSAVSGTEHFIDQFSFWPLICALKKYQRKKMTIELVLKMAKIKNDDGDIMAKVMRRNLIVVTRLWSQYFGDSSDLQTMLKTAPKEIQQLFEP